MAAARLLLPNRLKAWIDSVTTKGCGSLTLPMITSPSDENQLLVSVPTGVRPGEMQRQSMDLRDVQPGK